MKPLKQIILEAIQDKDEYNPSWTEVQCFRFAYGAFLRAKKKEIEQVGLFKALVNWFQGMGLNVPCWDNYIEELGHNPDTYWQELAVVLLRAVD